MILNDLVGKTVRVIVIHCDKLVSRTQGQLVYAMGNGFAVTPDGTSTYDAVFLEEDDCKIDVVEGIPRIRYYL